MDRWETHLVSCEGGLDESRNTIVQPQGSALTLINYEPSIYGGYRRINGFTKYHADVVPGSGKVLGVHVFKDGVIAARSDDVYYNTGSGWGSTIGTRTSGGKYRFSTYTWGTERVIMCDGVNPAAKFDGTTYTLINGTDTPTNPKYVAEHYERIWLAGMSGTPNSLVASGIGSETDFTAGGGALEFAMGDEITGIKPFRGSLYVFCKTSIFKIEGTSVSNFTAVPVSRKLGCTAPDSIQEINGDILFLSNDTIRVLTSTERVDDTEIGRISERIQPTAMTLIRSNSDPDTMSAVVVTAKTQYRLYYPEASDPVNYARGIIGALRRGLGGNDEHNAPGAWEWGLLEGVKPSCASSNFIDQIEYVVFGAWDGFIYRLEQGNAFTYDASTNNIQSAYFTPNMLIKDPAIRKIAHKLTVYYRVEGTTSLTTRIIYDFENSQAMQPPTFVITEGGNTSIYGTSLYDTAVYGGELYPESTNNVVGSGKAIQIRFTTDDQNPSHTIQGFQLQLELADRR